MSEFIIIVMRTIFAFFLFMVITFFLGKQIISRITSYHFIAAATFGSITANLAFNIHNEAWQVATAMITFFFIAFIFAIISLKSRKARKWLAGKPTVIIENGKVLEGNLKRNRFTMDTLNHELRQKDIFNIQEVQNAIIEPNGAISILKKPEYRSLTKKDLGILFSDKNHFPIELIMEGSILTSNMENNGLTIEWLLDELSKRGLTKANVFYAVKATNGQLYFDVYNDHVTPSVNNKS